MLSRYAATAVSGENTTCRDPIKYAHLVELGHVDSQPFLTPAFEATKHTALNAIAQATREGIAVEEAEKLVATLGKLDAKAAQFDLGKSIFDATRTPLEKFRADIASAVKLLDVGAINKATFTRHIDALRSTAVDTMAPMPDRSTDVPPG